MSVLDRAARVAYTFLMMNYSAVAGLLALRHGRQVWTPSAPAADERAAENL